MVAPTVGGYVTAGFGWEAVFLILAGMAAVILIAVYIGLPESSRPDPTYSLRPEPIISKFLQVIKEPQFYTYALSGAVSRPPGPPRQGPARAAHPHRQAAGTARAPYPSP